MFQDIFPIFHNPEAVEAMVNHFVNHIKETNPNGVDAIVGLDARGFLFGIYLKYLKYFKKIC